MTNTASRAGRVLSRQRHAYTITCPFCGRVAAKKGYPKAKTCGKPRCVYQARKARSLR